MEGHVDLERAYVLYNRLVADKIITRDFKLTYFGHYDNSDEALKLHKKLVKDEVVDGDFDVTYAGKFMTPEAFAYFRLYGDNNVCGLPDKDYADYAEEIFSKQFVYIDGHVFER